MIAPSTTSPVHLANMANAMSKDCKNEKTAMILQYVALGSMGLMGLAAGVHIIKDIFSSKEHGHGHGR
jgi:hypothetical protein